MENKKMCVWKRGGYFFIATLLGAGPFSSHVYAGTDHDQFNSVVTELNYGLNLKKGKKVTGTIIDETGEPVIGANVVQKGTTNGSITDIDGRFSLEIPEDAILEIFEMYRPLLIKNALVDGIFDEDLYQELTAELLKCIRYFRDVE